MHFDINLIPKIMKRDIEVINKIAFGENYKDVLVNLPDDLKSDWVVTVNESLMKYYLSLIMEYGYQFFTDKTSSLLTEMSSDEIVESTKKYIKEMISKKPELKQKLVENTTSLLSKLAEKVDIEIKTKHVDSILSIGLIAESLEYIYGSKQLAHDIAKSYCNISATVLNIEKNS